MKEIKTIKNWQLAWLPNTDVPKNGVALACELDEEKYGFFLIK